ncbi:MAG TPA: hypothetical protein DC034_13200 [Clostridium sp.]|jgi:beta-lactamase regulating signal transducer with metallopeptidase domain|nr:hypothetical protein [Clostridium sp.]
MDNIGFVMSLSGSVVLLVYIAAYPFIKNIFKAKWKCYILRFSIICFLVPIPSLYFVLKGLYNRILTLTNRPQLIEKRINLNKDFYIFINNNEIQFSKFQLILNLFYIVCFIIASVVLLLEIYKYIGLRKLISKCSYENISDEYQLLVSEKNKMKLKKKASLQKSKFVSTPSTTGVFHSVILLPYKFDDKNLRGILRHELAHIKHNDTFWYFLIILAIGIHWFNPFTYILFYCMKEVREQYCDEVAVEGLDQIGKIEYCSSIINLSKRNTTKEQDSFMLGYVSNIDTKGRIKRRISLIMNRTKKNKIIFSLFVFSLFMAVGFTANLYKPTMVIYASEKIGADGDEFIAGELIVDEFLYASDYFVDEYGNTFSIPDSELKVSCVHNYIQGNRKIHYKISNGGCDLKYYDSKRCTMCGKVMLGELFKTETYEKCSHRFGEKE